MNQPVLIDNEDGIVTLTLNLPETRNPISGSAMIEAIIAAAAQANDDREVRVLIVTGAGRAFSSGGDIRDMAQGGELNDIDPLVTRRNYKTGIQRIPLLFDSLEVPVIAAVNGPAIGAGCDLACMCDIRIASESAKFAESFVKLGIVPGDGGAWFLPQVVGFAKASEMALTGDILDAHEALRCGLVSRVVPGEQLMREAKAIAARIAAHPRGAVRMTKRLLREGRRASLQGILELSASMQALAHTSPDHREAVSRFLEKRPS